MMSKLAELLLILVWLWPLLLLIPLLMKHQQVLSWACSAALPATLLAIVSLSHPADFSLSLPWLLLGSHFGTDPAGEVFLLASSILWLCGGFYARAYFSCAQHLQRFMVFYLLAMAGNIGLIVAQDMASFFFFFALMSFSSYGLVVYEGSADARIAGVVYICLVILSEILLWSGMISIVKSSGSLEFAQLALFSGYQQPPFAWPLLLLGLGIKAGLIGVHVWLPLAHSVAPTPASAVLSGAMIKAGLIGWLRLLPLGETALPTLGNSLLWAGLGATFYAAAIGCTQRNPKTVLAYSSVSQMGVMITLVGLGLIMPPLWPQCLAALMIYVLHHGLVKGGLFFGVGIVRQSIGCQWLVAMLMLWLALAMVGAPLSSGMVAKQALKQALVDAQPAYHYLLNALPVSSLATGLLMARCLFLLWQERQDGQPQVAQQIHSRQHSHQPHVTDNKASGMLWALWLCVLSASLSTWLIFPAHSPVWAFSILWAALWPCLLAALVATIIAWLWLKASPGATAAVHFWHIPAGDILIPMLWLTSKVRHKVSRFCIDFLPNALCYVRNRLDLPAKLQRCVHSMDQIEQGMSQWPLTIILVFLLVTLMVLSSY